MSEIILKKAIDKWGEHAQYDMAQEEATELALAIRKFVRDPCEARMEQLAGEIADVSIMIEQMFLMNPSLETRIPGIRKFKLERLERRIQESDFEGS